MWEYPLEVGLQQNVVPQLSEQFLEFVARAPFLEIASTLVENIKSDLFDEMRQQLAATIERLEKDKAALLKRIEEQIKEQRQQHVENERHRKEMEEKYGKEIAAVRKSLDKVKKTNTALVVGMTIAAVGAAALVGVPLFL